MIDVVQIKKSLYEWASEITGQTVMFSDDNGQKPSTVFIALNIESIDPKGTMDEGPITEQLDGSMGQSKGQVYELEVKAIAYGKNAMGCVNKLIVGEAVHPSAKNRLRESCGISFLRASKPMNITGLNDTKKEERAFVILTFSFKSKYLLSNVDNVISSVEYTLEAVHENGNISNDTWVIPKQP